MLQDMQGYIWLYSPKHKGRNVKEVSKLLVRCNNVWSLAGGTPLRVFLVVMLPCGTVPCAPGCFFCHETEEKHILGHVHSWSLGYKCFFYEKLGHITKTGGHFFLFYCLGVLITTFSKSEPWQTWPRCTQQNTWQSSCGCISLWP